MSAIQMKTDMSTHRNYTGRSSCPRRDHRCCHGMFRRTQSLYAMKQPSLVGDKTNIQYFRFSSYLKASVFIFNLTFIIPMCLSSSHKV